MKPSHVLLAVILGLTSQVAHAWTPGTGSPTAADGLSVDTTNRRDTLVFYQAMYKASDSYATDMAWDGNVSNGLPGTTSAIFKEHVRRRINFYRAMAGLPGDITFNATKSLKDQKAALVFSRNGKISHNIDTTWTYYSADAAEAAVKSNLILGSYGPLAIDNFMDDLGTTNKAVGHRRWFLYPQAQDMGTGDIPANGTYSAANAVWVSGDFKPIPAATHTKWPNEGYCPITLIPARWSLSYPGAYFDNATVTMTRNGANIPLTIISNIDDSAGGDHTLVWEPTNLPTVAPTDISYTVTVSNINLGGTFVGNVLTGGTYHSHTYTVQVFDPENLAETMTINGSATPPASTSTYTFNPIEQADSYQLVVAKAAAATWTEGAENTTPSLISSSITGYTDSGLRQTARKRSGSRAFQLTFPNESSIGNQSFTLLRNTIPTASSSLQFYQLAQATGTGDRLSAQISTDGGGSWTTLWSRMGNGGSTSQTTFQSVSTSLSAYAGMIVRFRFLLEYTVAGSSTYLGTASNTGFFIDDISVTNASEITTQTATTLPSSATSFTLNSTTAGAELTAGTPYLLSIRPNVGLHLLSYSTVKTVTPVTPTGYDAWVANTYPTVTGGQAADQDKDGLSNAIEYAFGLNPTTPTSSSALPKPSVSRSIMSVTFFTPSGVTGVTYGMQWSTDLAMWTDLADTGSGNSHVFSLSTTGRPALFFRHRPVLTP